MKFHFKKNYIILFFLIILLTSQESYSRDNKTIYTKENISNYFLGIISVKKDYLIEALKHLKKVESLKTNILHLMLNLSDHLCFKKRL